MLRSTMARYLVISGFTFCLDLALLTAVHGGLGWPLPVAVTVGYGVALSVNYLLNRVLNFRSHAPIGPESLRYGGAVAVNFAVVLLGVTTGLAAVGVPYQAARIAAGGCEGIFMYGAMRWFVFPSPSTRRRPGPVGSTVSQSGAPESRRPTGPAAR